MKIEVRNTTLIVQGSLLKYFKGYNYAECLSVWDVRKSINKLSNELNVPMRQAVINRIDIGICFLWLMFLGYIGIVCFIAMVIFVLI